MGGGGDAAVGEDQPVVPSEGVGPVGPAVAVERLVQPAPARVAGEELAGAVGAVRGGRQADDQQARPLVAQAGDGSSPVLLAGKLALPDPSDRTTVCAEARTSFTFDDGLRERGERRDGSRGVHHETNEGPVLLAL